MYHIKSNKTIVINENLYIEYDFKEIKNIYIRGENFAVNTQIFLLFNFYLNELQLNNREEIRLFQDIQDISVSDVLSFAEKLKCKLNKNKIEEALEELKKNKDPSATKNIEKLLSGINKGLNSKFEISDSSRIILKDKSVKDKIDKAIKEVSEKGYYE